MMRSEDIYVRDFTLNNYKRLVQLVKKSYRLIGYAHYKTSGRCCLWRHDVDFSLHRALKCAKIEADADVHATYFLHLHSSYYNPLEHQATRYIQSILAHGHRIGLHFDPAYWKRNSHSTLAEGLQFEKGILEQTYNITVSAFSVHNPDQVDWGTIHEDQVEGMINCYGPYLQRQYTYCSDSNGFWRFTRLEDVLKDDETEKLQVLTHPAWWTDKPMSPRRRIVSCIEQRTRSQLERYDASLAEAGRPNIR